MHEYSEFAAEYRRCAGELDLPKHAKEPTRTQYYKWVGGQVGMPRGYHCAVLEKMFPGWTAAQLFGDAPSSSVRAHDDLLALVGSAIDPAVLNGVWATAYRFDEVLHHADLSVITMSGTDLSAANFPPEPRTERHATSYRNRITGSLAGRQILARWRNVSDDYYYGSCHLAVQPGENMLDGIYTGFPADTQVVAERWRWVRVAHCQPRDLATVRLREPAEIYEMLTARAAFDGPVSLEELTED